MHDKGVSSVQSISDLLKINISFPNNYLLSKEITKYVCGLITKDEDREIIKKAICILGMDSYSNEENFPKNFCNPNQFSILEMINEIDRLHLQIEEILSERNEINILLNQKTRQISELIHESSILRTNYDEKIREISETVELLRDENIKFKEENKNCHSSIQMHKNKNQKLLMVYEKKKSRLFESNVHIKQLEDIIDSLVVEKGLLTKKCSRYCEEIEKLKLLITEYEKNINGIKSKKNTPSFSFSFENVINIVNTPISANDDELAQLQDEICLCNSRYQSLLEEVNGLYNELSVWRDNSIKNGEMYKDSHNIIKEISNIIDKPAETLPESIRSLLALSDCSIVENKLSKIVSVTNCLLGVIQSLLKSNTFSDISVLNNGFSPQDPKEIIRIHNELTTVRKFIENLNIENYDPKIQYLELFFGSDSTLSNIVNSLGFSFGPDVYAPFSVLVSINNYFFKLLSTFMSSIDSLKASYPKLFAFCNNTNDIISTIKKILTKVIKISTLIKDSSFLTSHNEDDIYIINSFIVSMMGFLQENSLTITSEGSLSTFVNNLICKNNDNNEKLNNLHEFYRETISMLTNEKIENQRRIEQLNLDFNKLQTETHELLDIINKKDLEIRKLKEETETAHEYRIEIEKAFKSLHSNNNNFESSIVSLRNENDRLKYLLNEKTVQIGKKIDLLLNNERRKNEKEIERIKENYKKIMNELNQKLSMMTKKYLRQKEMLASLANSYDLTNEKFKKTISKLIDENKTLSEK